jgi:hypothetical protein
MFCSNCGKEVAEGMRFCTNCGTPVASQAQAAVPPPQATLYTPPSAGVSGRSSTLLLDFIMRTSFGKINFTYSDANGKRISPNKLFNRSMFSVVMQALFLPIFFNGGFYIRVEFYDNKIRFIRLRGLGKNPSEDRFEINGAEIALVEMSNSITIITQTRGRVKFTAPKKYRERSIQIINAMISQNKS